MEYEHHRVTFIAERREEKRLCYREQDQPKKGKDVQAEMEEREIDKEQAYKEYVVIHAKENGVHVIGLTRGESTKFHHTEKLDRNEVMIAQFTEHTSAMKIRGKAVIYTAVGIIDTREE